MTEIVFTYTGKIGKNHGIDGVQEAVEGQVFNAETIQHKKWADIWLKDGLAILKADKPKPKEVQEAVDQKEEKEDKEAGRVSTKRGRKKKGK